MNTSRRNHIARLGLAAAAFLLVLPLAAFPTAGSAEIAPQLRDLAVKGDRLALQDRDVVLSAACAGQAWGDESLGCLMAIAEAGGRSGLQGLRIVSRGEPDRQHPNIF